MRATIAITDGTTIVKRFEYTDFFFIGDGVIRIDNDIIVDQIMPMESYDHITYTGFMALPPTKKPFITYRKVDIHIWL